jgi:hypothetical protein
MAKVGAYVKPAPIGSNVITTDDVIAAGYDFVYLKMGGMLKVQGATVDGDLTLKGDTAFNVKPLAFTTNLANQSVAAAADATFTVVVTGGVGAKSYKWFWNGIWIDPAINPTAATAALVNHAVTEESEGTYHVEVRDEADNVLVSLPSVLTVTA